MPKERVENLDQIESPREERAVLAALDPESLSDALLENCLEQEDCAEVRKQYEACLRYKEKSGFSGVEESADGAIQIARSAANIAFIKKEKAEHPDRNFLKELYDRSIGNQDFLNFMVRAEGLFFDAKGEPVGLEGYLQDHYKELVGDDVTIKITDGSIKEFPHLADDKTMTEEAREVADRERSGLPMPVLELIDGKKGRTTRIPFIANLEYLKEGGMSACYRYVSRSDGPAKQDIVVRPVRALGEDRPSLIEHMASLIHEVDHAVYDTLHKSDSRALMQDMEDCERQAERLRAAVGTISTEADLKDHDRLMDNNAARLSRLRMQQLVNDSASELAGATVFEGLARRSEGQFMTRQISALARYEDDPENFTAAASFIRGRQLLVDRANPRFVLYGAGDILVDAAIGQGGAKELYESDVLEKGIVGRPEIVRTTLRRLSKERAVIVDQPDNPVSEYIPAGNSSEYQRNINTAIMKSGITPGAFLLGEEYFRLLDDIDKKVEGMENAAVAERILEITKDPAAMEEFKYAILNHPDEDERRLLLRLELSFGELAKREKEEWDKVYAEEE